MQSPSYGHAGQSSFSHASVPVSPVGPSSVSGPVPPVPGNVPVSSDIVPPQTPVSSSGSVSVPPPVGDWPVIDSGASVELPASPSSSSEPPICPTPFVGGVQPIASPPTIPIHPSRATQSIVPPIMTCVAPSVRGSVTTPAGYRGALVIA